MKSKKRRKLTLLVWILLCGLLAGPSAFADSRAESWEKLSGSIFEHLGSLNGLPNAMVTVVAEDGDGFLWVGTPSGLARWDGYRFHVYVGGTGDGAGLPDNIVQRLYTDPAGQLWVGFNAGGLARYDPKSNQFITVSLDPGYSAGAVHSIADDGAGGLWIGTEDGLEHLARGASVAKRVDSLGEVNGPRGQRITSLLRDRNGILWAGTSAGLYRLDHEGAQFVHVPISGVKNADPHITALFQDSDGGIWIGTGTEGAFLLERGRGMPRIVHERGEADSKIETQWITAFSEVTHGHIWLSTYGEGIVSLDLRTGLTQRLRHNQAQPTSLQHDVVWDMYRDHSGQIWVGSMGGLDHYDPSRTAISTVFGGNGGGKLFNMDVRSVFSPDQNHVWLGLGDEGVDVVEPTEGRITKVLSALPHGPVSALVKSPSGDFFAASRHGVFRLPAADGRITRLTVSSEYPEMSVNALMAQGTALWIGATDDGLWKYDTGSAQGGTRIGRISLTDQRIRSLMAAPGGRLWVGTRNGLNLVNPETERVERILPDSKDPQSLSAGLVSSLLTDRQGRLWASTEGGGINLLEGRDAYGRPRFRHFGMAQGLPHNNVNKLLMDKSGKIWASTDDGLASIDPDTFKIRAFRRAEGVSIATYWINSGDVTEDGDLLFGGIGGLTVVHPDQITDWTYVPPIVVTDLRLGGQAVPPGRFAKEPVIVQPKANSLAVEFSALDFTAPERNRYAYKLDGFDKDWVETDSSRRLASYTNLAPGSYTLRLKGSNRDGVWAETSLDLPIRILPAWYQTLWFRLALVASGGLLIALLVRSRTAYYRQRQEKLERQVERRTVELKTTTDQLKALLDNSGQGFLSFGEDLIVDSEYSLACETMLGLVPAGMSVDRALFGFDEKQAQLFRRAAEAFRQCDDYKRRSVLLSLFPRDIRRGGLRIDASYRRIDNERLMAILTDVTEERRLADKLETNYRRQDMVVAAVIESRDFFDAVENYRHFINVELPDLLTREEMPEALLAKTFRTVHTFKGVLDQFNFERSPKALHELEEVLTDFAAAGGSETVEMLHAATDFAQLRRCLALDLAVVEGMLGSDFIESGARIAVPAAQADAFSQLGERLLAGGSVDLTDPAERDLLRDLSRMHYVGLDRILHGYDRMVRQLAESLGKAIAPLAVEGGEGILVDPRRYRDFLQSLVHVFRNAVAHGIERPDDRVDAGKDEAGMILCTVTQQAGAVTIAIADDGAGVDLDLLRARLADIGLPADLSDEAVMQSVFTDQVSTQELPDEVSGRGIGLGAVRQSVEALGGTVTVSSVPQRGAVFKFILPLDVGISVPEAAKARGE